MKDKTFLTLTGIFFLVLFGGIATVALQSPQSTILRAKNAAPSPLKSFVIVFPQVGAIGDQLKVTVSMRDVNGSVLPNRSVRIHSETPSLTIQPTDMQTTNVNGQAQFFISSSEPGTTRLTVTDVSSNIEVANIPSVEFIRE